MGKTLIAAALLTAATQVGAFCPKSGERTEGMNKICYYKCVSGTVAITVRATELCPISISGNRSEPVARLQEAEERAQSTWALAQISTQTDQRRSTMKN